MLQERDLGLRRAIAAVVLILSGVVASANETTWVDRYIEGHGACEQPLTVLQPQPLGLPIQEWTDDDLAKLKAAIERCEAKYQNERHIPLRWGSLVFDAVVNDVKAHRRYVARQTAQAEARETEARQVEQARKRQIEAREREWEAREDEAIVAKKAADARAAQALAQRQERDRVREQSKLAEIKEQAKRDREAADRLKSLANQEAPRIREIEREASEARRARVDAERQLDKMRRDAAAAEERRNTADAAARSAKERRIHIEKQSAERLREQREFEALAKTCSISAEQFGNVRVGMSLREVRQAFGCVGSLTTSTEIAGAGVFSVYQWVGPTSGAFAMTTFNDDRLVSKSQNALN